jgi:hypothetical protein
MVTFHMKHAGFGRTGISHHTISLVVGPYWESKNCCLKPREEEDDVAEIKVPGVVSMVVAGTCVRRSEQRAAYESCRLLSLAVYCLTG